MTSIEEALLKLDKLGYSVPSVERILDLKPGTLKTDNASGDPVTLALFDILNAFPWILKVAEEDFNEKEAKYLLLTNFLKEYIKNVV
jgi:hypothetical protein